ncbi:hypothetical protein [Candidatus Methylomirabilis sp.]|uniref:capsular polysaccharide export protein, LipB/KpsS family n=1 Tax=Candidatus Methylomirabilis sp. TaxID=2032687 RepID=UPI003076639A
MRLILEPVGLLPAARLLRRVILAVIKPEVRRQELERLRRERARRKRFLQFKRQYEDILQHSLISGGNGHKRVLIIGAIRLLEIELGLIKALELAGFKPVVLILGNSRVLKRYYNLTGVREFHFWSEYIPSSRFFSAAKAVVDQRRSLEELLTFEYAGAHVGRIAASTTLRLLRLGSLDLTLDGVRHTVAEQVALGMASAIAAQNVLRRIQPRLALSIETGYTGKGELFDNCLANGVDVIRWHPAHKSNTLMLKRYTLENSYDHPHSLSSQSWRSVRAMEWTDAHREQLQRELYVGYASGDWYGENGTQFNKRLMDADEVQKRFGLDPGKKTVFLFPHIFWDASFSWGDDLFGNYEEWFIKTVQAACANDRVNWVIKIHPAHAGKGGKNGCHGEPAEVMTLRAHIGELPPHIVLIPADSDICTYSLFDLMDYCVTVRGTIGIEAAVRGIPVLTAGTGRYDHKGFTVDSETREEYLERIAHIQDIPPLSPTQRELAERYAYGLFLLRPLPLTSMTLEFGRDNDPDNYFSQTRFHIRTKEEWQTASDLGAFVEWVTHSHDEDFMDISCLEK